MNARHKLNAAYTYGSLIVAGTAGLLTGSWAVFLIGTAALLGLCCCTGGIRPRGRGGRGR